MVVLWDRRRPWVHPRCNDPPLKIIYTTCSVPEVNHRLATFCSLCSLKMQSVADTLLCSAPYECCDPLDAKDIRTCIRIHILFHENVTQKTRSTESICFDQLDSTAAARIQKKHVLIASMQTCMDASSKCRII